MSYRSLMPPTRLAYMGEPGAFGEAACLLADPAAVPTPFPTAQAAVDAVRAGACAAVVLPVHNSVAGPVHAITAMLPASGLDTVAHIDVPITMALLAAPGTTLRQIRTVTSHPIALAQCSRLIARLGLASEPALTTTAAAAALARAPALDRAVLAAPRAAAHYGLLILASDIGDDPRAMTRFAVLQRPPT
jgi:prephenate dehydratase